MPAFSFLLRSLLLALLFLSFSITARADSGKKTWRVLYVEGGPFSNYQQTLAHTARRLEKLGIIDNSQVPIPEGQNVPTICGFGWPIMPKGASDFCGTAIIPQNGML